MAQSTTLFGEAQVATSDANPLENTHEAVEALHRIVYQYNGGAKEALFRLSAEEVAHVRLYMHEVAKLAEHVEEAAADLYLAECRKEAVGAGR